MQRPDEYYNALAYQAVLDLLDREDAVIWAEVEAKLSDAPYPGAPYGIDPNHLTNAKAKLLSEGRIRLVTEETRGGRKIDVYGLSDLKGRKTKFDRAAARKRLLEARYLGWTIHGSHGPSLIGRAGERVAHASLEGAAALSLPNRHYMLVPRSAQGVKMLLNERMDGPLDDAAYLTVISNGMPYAMTVPIEVKNVRHRLYPRAHEIYQLIRKASLLQAKHPEAPVLPVLICRRKHYLLHSMAVDLGFFVFETRIQPILPHSEVSPADVEEVRSVLGYNLMIMDNSLGELVTWFKDTLPKFGVKTSAQWQKSAPVLHALESAVRQLGDPSLRESDRTRVLAELQRHLITELGLAGAWVAKEAQRLESELSDEDYDDF